MLSNSNTQFYLRFYILTCEKEKRKTILNMQTEQIKLFNCFLYIYSGVVGPHSKNTTTTAG